jgi:ABC-type dipeptide/oligopeptide/nickel transport system ATPase component
MTRKRKIDDDDVKSKKLKIDKKIIGITGVAGAGKDTAALAILELNPSNTEIMSFAKPLKDACKILFNFTDEQLYHPIFKEEYDERWGRSPRQILQWLGTDVLRDHIDENFFVINMEQRISNSKAKYIVIPDVRFDNEGNAIRFLGGEILKVEREGAKTTKHSGHITEKGINRRLVNHKIKNNSSIRKFRSNVQKLVSSILQ